MRQNRVSFILGALKISRVPWRGEATRAAGMRRHGRRFARKNRIPRTATSTIRGKPRRGDDRVDARERSSPRRPLRKNWANWRENQKPRQHPERGSRAKGRRARRTRGRARIRRTGLQRRARSPSIRSSVRGARSRIARIGEARIPTSRPAPVSPVFPLAWTGKCAEAWAGERAFERSASSPLRCEGSSTFARVLACRHRGVSKSEDWRAAVNRVRRGAAQKCLNRGHRARLIFGANCQSVNVSQTVGPITVSRNRMGI